MEHSSMVTQLTRATTKPLELTGPILRKWRKTRSNITLISRPHLFRHLSLLLGETLQMRKRLRSRRSMTTLGMRPRSRLISYFWVPMATRARSCTSTRWSTHRERSNEGRWRDHILFFFTVDINKQHTTKCRCNNACAQSIYTHSH